VQNGLALEGGTAVRDGSRKWPTWPEHGEPEQSAIAAVVASGVWAEGDGPRVMAMSRRFAAVHQVAHGVAVSSGTAALWIALKALGVGPGD